MSALLLAGHVLAAAGDAAAGAAGADAGAAGGDAGAGGAAAGCGGGVLGAVCQAAGNAVNAVAQTAIQAFVDDFADAFGKTLKVMVTFWTDLPTPTLDQAPVHMLQGATYWLQGALLVASFLYVAAKMAITRNSDVAVMTGVDLIRMVFFVGVGVPAIDLLAAFGDTFSQWILDQSTNGDLATNFLRLGGGTAGLQGLGIGLEFLIALIGSISAIAQVFLLFARIGILILLVGTLPLTAAALITPAGKTSFNKILGWIVAWLLYKPVAAMVYAAAFFLTATGVDLMSILSGLLLMVLAVFALPALMKLCAPLVAAATSGGGGALLAAGAGGALATGARTLSERSGGGGGGGSDSGPPTHQPGLAPSDPSPTGATSAGSVGSAGGGGAPGPSGAGGGTGAAGAAAAESAGAGAAGGATGAGAAGAGAAEAGTAAAAAGAGAATAGVGAVVVVGASMAKAGYDQASSTANSIANDTTGGS